MKKAVAVFLLLVSISSVMLITGCATTTNIGDITANPSQYKGEEVIISGTASNSFWLALVARGAYKLTDDTGSIWVVCRHTPPDENEELKIKGTVEDAVTIGDRSLGTVIIETERSQD